MGDQSKTTAVTTTAPKPQTAATTEWELLQRQCRAFVDSGLLPDHVVKGFEPKVALARALTIAWKGRELGVPPMQAFASITVIGGKPCIGAELMLALIYQRIPGAKVTFRETTKAVATVEMQRPGGEPQTFSFTWEDAQVAGLTGKDAWKKYPATMLRWRVISAGARAVFPDCIMGCYTPEEMGADPIDVEFSELVELPERKEPPKKAAPNLRPAKAPSPTGQDDRLVTEKQITRLYAIASGNRWTRDDVHQFIEERYGKTSAKDLNRTEYNAVCEHIMEGPAVGSDEDIALAAIETKFAPEEATT